MDEIRYWVFHADQLDEALRAWIAEGRGTGDDAVTIKRFLNSDTALTRGLRQQRGGKTAVESAS